MCFLTISLPTRAVVLVAVLVAGCASAPSAPRAPEQLVVSTPSLEQMMSEAARAKAEGAYTTEREAYHKAAQAYPTSKQPWLALAEGYFNATDYGNAIRAAQEVLQRDPADRVANSLLAVSGLRVSASALASMRDRQNMGTDTRRQAEDLVRTLREALGEPLLLPAPVTAPPPASVPARRPVRRSQPTAAEKTPAPAVDGVKAPANPFQTLMK